MQNLTKREVEVLVALVLFESGKEAAAALGISIHTFKSYLSIIYKKLDVTNQLGALKKVGWLTVGDQHYSGNDPAKGCGLMIIIFAILVGIAAAVGVVIWMRSLNLLSV